MELAAQYPKTDMGYPDAGLPDYPNFDLDPPADAEVRSALDALRDYEKRWSEETNQELDDWEYLFYGIPAGHESFFNLGD